MFREHYECAVDALLNKDYRAAYDAFVCASQLRPTDRHVVANLQRLAEMGFAEGAP